MPEQALKRDTAKAEYVSRMRKGEKVTLQDIADEFQVSRSTVVRWKREDKWDEAARKKSRRGAPKGNQNSKGKRNAERDGTYSTIDLGSLSDAEAAMVKKTPVAAKAALVDEMKVLKLREKRILSSISLYEAKEAENPEWLYLTTQTDMYNTETGSTQMFNKDTPFVRIIKLQAALDRVQGRIARIAETLRTIEDNDRRFKLEQQKIDIMKMRITGAVDVVDADVIVDALPEEPPQELPEGV